MADPQFYRSLPPYLPDLQPDEPFEDTCRENDGTGEPGFGERVTLALKPIRRPAPPTLPIDEDSNEYGDGDGSDTGGAGGGGTDANQGSEGTGGVGEGEGQGGTGGRGGRRPRESGIPISGVRIFRSQVKKTATNSASDLVARAWCG